MRRAPAKPVRAHCVRLRCTLAVQEHDLRAKIFFTLHTITIATFVQPFPNTIYDVQLQKTIKLRTQPHH